MALFQPSNITPSVLAGVGQGIVDVADELDVKWQVNGTSPLTAFNIDFYENDAASTFVSSSNYQVVSPAFYGTDAKGNIVPYEFTNDGYWGVDYDLVNGKTYKMKITQFGQNVSVSRYTTSAVAYGGSTYAFAINGIYYSFTAPSNIASGSTIDIHSGNLLIFNIGSYSQGNAIISAYATVSASYDGTSVLLAGNSSVASAKEVVTQTSETVFITRQTPTLSYYFVTALSVVSHTFTATYSQAQGDAIKWARWQLALIKDGQRVIIDDTGEITTGVLSYTYDSFLNDNTYSIRLIVESENGQRVDTDWHDIEVSYNVGTAGTGISAVCDDTDGSVKLTWQAPSVIPGECNLGTGGYTISDGKITLPSSMSIITWDEVDGESMSFAAPYSAAWRGECIGKFTQSKGVTFHSTNTQCAAFSPNGYLLISGYSTTDIYLSTMYGGLTYQSSVNKASQYIAFNSTGSVVIIGKSIYSATNAMALTYVADIPNGSDYSPSAFSSDDQFLFHGRYMHRISGTSITESIEIEAAPASVSTIAVFPTTDTRELILNGSIYTYYQEVGQPLRQPSYQRNMQIGDVGVDATVLSMSSNGSKIAAIVGGTPCLFTNSQLYYTITLDGYFDETITDAFRIAIDRSSTPKYVAVSTRSHGVRIYNAATRELITILKYNNAQVPEGSNLLAFDNFTSKLISGYFNYMAISYDIPSAATVLFSINNAISVENNDTVIGITQGGTTTDLITVPPGTNNAIIALSSSKLKCYFYYNTTFNSLVEADVSLTLPAITSFKIQGAQVCDWIYVTPNEDYDYRAVDKPAYNGAAYMFADFNGTLDAGATEATDTDYNSIYRADTSDGIMRKLFDLPSAYAQIKDYGVKSLSPHKYRMYYLSESGYYSSAAETPELCNRLTSYYLIEAAEDANVANVFHVKKVWRFGNNYSGGGVQNGNAPQFLTNFTRYPLRQGSSVSPKSGTLTALLSNFTDSGYEDTADEMDALYELSLSQNHIFLKDTKGNIYEVHTSAPISMAIDTASRAQEVSVSVPWQEVADATDAVIIQTPLDADWSV